MGQKRRERTTISERFADERCSEAILLFFGRTGVGRIVPPEEEAEESEASEMEGREDV
jgi:hypothetical protein